MKTLHMCTSDSNVISKTDSSKLLGRTDIRIEELEVNFEKLIGYPVKNSSESIRQRIQCAGVIQQTYFTKFISQSTSIIYNADIRVGETCQFCRLQEEGQSLMWAAMDHLNLSARAYHRSLKLARTIADLAGSEDTQSQHLAEALPYRSKLMLG